MAELNFEKGLVAAVAQDCDTGDVLMLAYMNKEAFDKTVKTGKAHYYSRSRQSLWCKGESSGHTQEVKEILVDCDRDSVVLKVDQKGGACHLGYRSCFFRKYEDGGLIEVDEPLFDPDSVYGDE